MDDGPLRLLSTSRTEIKVPRVFLWTVENAPLTLAIGHPFTQYGAGPLKTEMCCSPLLASV